MGRPTKAQQEAKKQAELEVEEKNVSKKTRKQRRKKNISKDLYINTIQATEGGFTWIDKKTGEEHKTFFYGDEDEYTFGELQRMSRTARACLQLFYVCPVSVEENDEDITLDDVLKALKIEDLYIEVSPEKIEYMLFEADSKEFDKFCRSITKQMLRIVYLRAYGLFDEGEFSDKLKMNIIEAVSEKQDLFK